MCLIFVCLDVMLMLTFPRLSGGSLMKSLGKLCFLAIMSSPLDTSKPDVSYFCVFGCDAYANIPKV